MYRVTIYTISIYTLRTESLCEAGSLTEDIISNTTCKVHNTSFLCFVSFSVPKLFCCFLTGWIERMISNHDFSFKMSAWPCYEIDSGWNNVQVWRTVQVLYFGPREHLFIYLLFFIILLKDVTANAFGIWSLRNTGKSVANWVTHMLLYTLH